MEIAVDRVERSNAVVGRGEERDVAVGDADRLQHGPAVAFAGQTVKVPVKVVRAKEDRATSFKQDVMPVFMRAGCNQGGCHGAARGR